MLHKNNAIISMGFCLLHIYCSVDLCDVTATSKSHLWIMYMCLPVAVISLSGSFLIMFPALCKLSPYLASSSATGVSVTASDIGTDGWTFKGSFAVYLLEENCIKKL